MLVKRLLGVPVVVAALALALWPLQAAQAATTTVTLTDNAYSPQSVTIKVNDTALWKVPPNVVGSCHSVSSSDGLFDSGTLATGLLCLGGGAPSWPHTFTKAGTYHYFCKFVTNMTGVVTVEAPSPTPPPTPTPTRTPTPSPSPSLTPTPTPSASPTPTPTPSPSPSPSASSSPTPTPSPTDSSLAAAPSSNRRGPSGPLLIAAVAALVALVCAVALVGLRRSGAW